MERKRGIDMTEGEERPAPGAARRAPARRTRGTPRKGIDQDQPFFLYAAPGHLVRRLHQIAVSIFLEKTRAFRITPVQYSALMAIRAFAGIDQRGLARVIAFDRSTIGSVVERLERRGLIVRETDRADRRYKALYVTPKGAQLLRDMEGAAHAVGETLLAPLSERDRRAFMRVLAKTVDLNNELSRAPLAALDEGEE
ncbi:MAG TPA: MarR family winged helix-turn-helix transcriptional regulator [Alphaproteobacteria bacterium]|jgi:DNA-binding MarR family transcriptional regulator|nr:MarR family winged helix-turn-helix transcriptional regulator [Alphaproteobacteria bacterium]